MISLVIIGTVFALAVVKEFSVIFYYNLLIKIHLNRERSISYPIPCSTIF